MLVWAFCTIERVEQFHNWEVELYRLADGTIVEGTYCIVEDVIDYNDLTIGPAA